MIHNILKIQYHYISNISNPIHIGYGIDENYARCCATSIASFCINNPKTIFCFHIMSKDLSISTKNKFQQLAKMYSININIYEINTDNLLNLPTQVHLPIATYFRFILPMILKDIDKLFYIDADIICLKKALDLFNIDVFNKVQKAISKEPKKFRYLDQDALNLILTKQINYINSKFNCLDINNINISDIILLHFAAHPKPWNIAFPISKAYNNFTKNLYKNYENQTPWKNTPLDMPRNYKEYKIYAKTLKNNSQYTKSIYWLLKYLVNKFN